MKSPLGNSLGFWAQQRSEGQAEHPGRDAAQSFSSFTSIAQKIPTWCSTNFFLAISTLHARLQHTFNLCLSVSHKAPSKHFIEIQT